RQVVDEQAAAGAARVVVGDQRVGGVCKKVYIVLVGESRPAADQRDAGAVGRVVGQDQRVREQGQGRVAAGLLDVDAPAAIGGVGGDRGVAERQAAGADEADTAALAGRTGGAAIRAPD